MSNVDTIENRPGVPSGGQLTRRAWLKWAGTAAGVLLVSGGVAWRNRDYFKWLQPGDVEQRLREHFHYLRFEIPSEEMRKFAGDYAAQYGKTARAGLYWTFKRRPAATHEAEWDQLATTFLLSTDFFLHGADEGKPVRYMTLYHPYFSPCWNPLSLAAKAAETPGDDLVSPATG